MSDKNKDECQKTAVTISKNKDEPLEMLLDPKYNRMTITPIMFNDIWQMYKLHKSSIWHEFEVKTDGDMNDWKELTDDARFFLKRILAFFASSDMMVSENIVERFAREVQVTEVRVFYVFQNMMENIHSEVYSNLIDAYITEPTEKNMLLNAVVTIPCIKKKADWARKWIDGAQSFSERLIAFALIEGVFFSGAFCSIYWMNERGKLPGLAKGNEFIARDEGIHVAFAVLLYTKYIQTRMSEERFAEIMNEAVNLEIEFITESLPCRLIGMNSTLMIEYIKYCSNRLSTQLGHEPLYPNAKQPFTFMDRICLREKSNFFEDESSSYKISADTDEDPYDDLE
jgi:ribonucleoside-diphosphate reductase beta chain